MGMGLQEGLHFAQVLDDVVQGEALRYWGSVAIVPAAVDTTAKGAHHISLEAVSDEEHFIGGYAASSHGFLKEGLAGFSAPMSSETKRSEK